MKAQKILVGLLIAFCAAAGCAGIAAELPRSAGAELTVTNSIGMQFVFIPAGSFTMGSPIDEPRREMDEVRHAVRITKGFYLGQTEVTREQFAAFVRETEYQTDAEKADDFDTWRTPGIDQQPDHPVVYVSWNDAQAFCKWLSEKEGRRYRLPTEAEWEYAARTGGSQPFGDAPTISSRDANYNGTTVYASGAPGPYRARTVPAGQFLPNPWGLYDMVGNVWEWCADWYGRYSSDTETDPQGASAGTVKVARGGSWANAPEYCRAAYRFGGNPASAYPTVGFRCVLDTTGGAPVKQTVQESARESPQTAALGRD